MSVRLRQVFGFRSCLSCGPKGRLVIAGFAIVQARSKDEAIEITKNFLKVVGDGECELRQIFEPSDQGTCGPDLKELAKT